MTRSTLFDRLNHELEAFGRRHSRRWTRASSRSSCSGLRRRQDNAARDLGLLIHRRERGGEVEPRRIDALLLRLDDLETEIERLEGQIAEARADPRAGRAAAAADPASTAAPLEPTALGPRRLLYPGARSRPGSGPDSCRRARPRRAAPAARGRRSRSRSTR